MLDNFPHGPDADIFVLATIYGLFIGCVSGYGLRLLFVVDRNSAGIVGCTSSCCACDHCVGRVVGWIVGKCFSTHMAENIFTFQIIVGKGLVRCFLVC